MRLFEFAFYLPKKLVSVDSSSSPISLVEESPTHSANTAGREIFELRSSGRLTGKPHLTLVSVGCCSRARVCLDRRSETQIFVDPGAFVGTDHNARQPRSIG